MIFKAIDKFTYVFTRTMVIKQSKHSKKTREFLCRKRLFHKGYQISEVTHCSSYGVEITLVVSSDSYEDMKEHQEQIKSFVSLNYNVDSSKIFELPEL